MWFVFPQIKGLGRSSMASQFAVASPAGSESLFTASGSRSRLIECTQLVNAIEGRSVEQIFGYPDDLKFRSCMTLFAHAAADNQVFTSALQKYFGGEPDPSPLSGFCQNRRYDEP